MENRNNVPVPLPFDRAGRPQIVVVGNGLERTDDSGGSPVDAGKSWDAMVESLKDPDCIAHRGSDLQSIPFPLKYHLLSSSKHAPYPLCAADRQREKTALARAAQSLDTVTNDALRRLRTLNADHIFTTNYTYSLERAFHGSKNMLDSKTRSAIRFNYCRELTKTGRQRLERDYRLYTGYLAKNADGSRVGLWHIHGECTVAGSIILGHDGYGRLLSRIVPVCGDRHKYHDLRPGKPYAFSSWPELFLFGDVYILGLGLGISEFDLWWLLRRKQREEKATGRVYFYTNDVDKAGKSDYLGRDLMLTALGVLVNPGGLARDRDYGRFYARALEDIGRRIAENRSARQGGAGLPPAPGSL